MYGRSAQTLYATFTNIKAGVAEDAFRSWYEDVHRPDSFDLGLFAAASRQRAASPSSAEWLTLWEASYPSPEQAIEKIRPVAHQLREQGRILPVLELVFQQFLKRAPLDFPSRRGTVRTLTTLQNDWAHPATDQDFAAWWREAVCARDTPLDVHHAAYAYAAHDLEDASAGKFLVLLESERVPGDVEAAWRPCGIGSLTNFGPATPIYPDPDEKNPARGQSDASPEARRALHVVHWEHQSDAVSAP